jgi:hypothetical protein
MLRMPHCLDNWLIDGGKVVGPTHRSHVTPQKHFFFLCFRYSFLLEAEQTPGPSAAGRIREISKYYLMLIGHFSTVNI